MAIKVSVVSSEYISLMIRTVFRNLRLGAIRNQVANGLRNNMPKFSCDYCDMYLYNSKAETPEADY